MKFLSLLFSLVFSIGLSQTQSIQNISEKLEDYFSEERLAIHLHTNKSVFFAGEELWYTAYGFDRVESKISPKNHTLLVSLYADNNESIVSSMLLLNEGNVSGSFILKPTLTSGTYYLKAHRPSMNALNEDESFVLPIHIINPEDHETTIAESTNKALDIQVLPEGGHLVSGISNTCGIKILNADGKGMPFRSIQLKDQNGNTLISNVKTNHLGMGKFSFIPSSNKKYSIVVDQQIVPLPHIKEKGIAMSSNTNFNTGDIQVQLETNNNSMTQLVDSELTVLIHKDGQSKGYTVSFEENFSQITFNIPNKQLYSGVNTITVLKEGTPILERLVFNHKSISETTALITETKRVQDTFSYTILNKRQRETVKSKVSVSVLPLENKSNSIREHIYASTYLKPFLKGAIENPSYYFTRNNYQKQYEIDLLLLNQGWSKYNWNSIAQFRKNNTLSFGPEAGLKLDGYVRSLNEKDRPARVLLYSKENETLTMSELNDALKFSLDSLNLTSGSRFQFSAIDTSGKPVEANFFYTLKPLERERLNRFTISNANPFSKELRPTSLINPTNAEALDTVVLTTTKLKYAKFFSSWEGRKMTPAEKSKGNLRNYIASFGYNSIFVDDFDSPKYQWRILGRKKVTPKGGTMIVEPVVIVDGIYYDAMTIGELISLQDVDEIYADYQGKSHVFMVFTNQEWKERTQIKTAKEFTVQNGFEPRKEYYTPQYTSYTNQSYKDFGVVAWYPDLTPNEDGTILVDLENPGKSDLIFYIEGFTETGEPIAAIQEVVINPGK